MPHFQLTLLRWFKRSEWLTQGDFASEVFNSLDSSLFFFYSQEEPPTRDDRNVTLEMLPS